MFAYCRNNPVNHSDPDGDWVMDAIFLAADLADFCATPSIVKFSWLIFDVASFADPTGIASTTAHVRKTAQIAEESIKVIKAINGNSKACQRIQHGYEIFEVGSKNVVKTGVSGGKINKFGKSQRATSQVNKWNKKEGFKKFDSRVVVKNIPGRERILKWEKLNAQRLLKSNDMYKHVTPR